MTKYHRQKIIERTRTRRAPKDIEHIFVDRLTLLVAIIEPIATLPQVYVIFAHKNAAGVSLSTWLAYDILNIVWLWYAALHKERIVFVYQGLFLVVQTAIIVGGMLYGAQW